MSAPSVVRSGLHISTPRRVRSRYRGQGIVEFAFVSIPLFVGIFAIIEFAYAMYCFSGVQNAAQEAARRGMVLNRIRTDTNDVGNSYTSDFNGNHSGNYTDFACDGGQTIAGTVKCKERGFLMFGTFTTTICAPTTTPDSGTCPIPVSAAVTIPAGRYVNVQVQYAYRPLITYPIPSPSGITMTGYAQTQTQ